MRNFFIKKGVKELLLSAVLLTLVLGPFQPLIAQADIPTSNDPAAYYGTANADGSATPASQGFGNLGSNLTPATSYPNASNIQNPGAAAQAQSGVTYKCSWGPSTWDLCLTNVVYVFTVGIGASFAYVAAYFFNLAVNLSLTGPAYALTFISTGWTTARDLANMAFLFILIYIAFTIMLQADTHGTKELLAGVIVIALLVNFSFFFTRVVIDAGNILSIQFYNSITAPSIQSSAQTSNVASVANTATSLLGANTPTKDLTASIMGMLQLQNLFNTTSFQNFYDSTHGKGPTTDAMVVITTLSFLYIGAAIMFYLITVMFVTAGIKFLVRIVILWFLIIASPLAFVARAVPQFKKYFDTWREMLVSHAFYPVAFMFIFLILTNFTNQMGSCSNSGGSSSQSCLINDIFTSLPAGSNTSTAVALGIAIANVAIRMGFVIAILYMGMKASDKISVMGADFAKSAGKSVGGMYSGIMKSGSRFTGNATIGGVGLVGRNTVGAAGNSLARNLVLRNWEAGGGIKGIVAKGLRGAGAATAGASFDARAMAGKGLVDVIGAPQKGGYTKEVKDSVHAKEERAKDLEPNAGDKARAHAIIEQEAKSGKTERGIEYGGHKIIHDASKKRVESIDSEISNLESQVGVDNSAVIKTLKAQKKAHQALVNTKEKKMKAIEKQVSGEGLKKEYANMLVRRRLGNLGGTFMRANREAADHIRHEKTAKDKFADAAKDYAKEQIKEEEGEPAAPASTATHTPAPTPTPAPAPDTHAAPDAGAHGGEHH